MKFIRFGDIKAFEQKYYKRCPCIDEFAHAPPRRKGFFDDFSEERPTFASGATKYLDLKDYSGLYSQAGTTYTDGDNLTFVFGADGKVAVTGQIFGVPVNSTATLGVNDKIEEGAKFECRAYFEANGRIYYLMCELPSSGTVTSDDIVGLDLSLVNGW